MKSQRTTHNSPNKQTRFLMSGVRLFLQKPELSQMTIQNEYGAISVRRNVPPKEHTYAVGFAVDDYDEEEYDDYVE